MFPRPELQENALMQGEIDLLLSVLPELLLELELQQSADRLSCAL
jgi:hypothetical protein